VCHRCTLLFNLGVLRAEEPTKETTTNETERDPQTGNFQGWEEKTNQTDQQLTAILRMYIRISQIGLVTGEVNQSLVSTPVINIQ